MPVFDFVCPTCGRVEEFYLKSSSSAPPECCGNTMQRKWSINNYVVKMGYPGWIDKIDDIQRRETDNGGRFRMPHPKEVGAS